MMHVSSFMKDGPDEPDRLLRFYGNTSELFLHARLVKVRRREKWGGIFLMSSQHRSAPIALVVNTAAGLRK